MQNSRRPNRRRILQTIGAGILGGVAVTGNASARGSYGNGNAIGQFLNEEAMLKDRPIWDSGIADMTGESLVEVAVGTMVTLDVPEDIPLPPGVEEPPEEGPFGYEPRAVEVSPGTTVRWVWTGNDFAFRPGVPWPHDVHSLAEASGHALFHSGEPQGTGTFSYDFTDPGTYLYFCHPHGDPLPDDHPNLFGMRGAVKVTEG